MTEKAGSAVNRPEGWDDIEQELCSAEREVTSLPFAWPSATSISRFQQFLDDRWSGNVRLPF